jgi:hypothetical protein
MEPSYQISPEKQCVRLAFEGAANYQEWERTIERVLHDPEYHPGFGFLVDRRWSPPPTSAYVERVAEYIHRHPDAFGPEIHSATIVADKASYGMARMMQGLVGSRRMGVFTTVEEAERWLDGGEGQ